MKKILLLAIMITGCAYPKRSSQYQSENLSPEKALIYIYRTPTSIDSLNPEIPKFFINQLTIGKLSIGGYYVQAVDPGEVAISYKDSFVGLYLWKSGEVKLTAQAGKKYFIKFSIESLMRIVSFKEVPANIGEEEIKSTYLLVN